MKCDLCRHEEVKGKLLCNPCSEMISRLLRINLAPEQSEKSLSAPDAHVSVAGAMF